MRLLLVDHFSKYHLQLNHFTQDQGSPMKYLHVRPLILLDPLTNSH